MLAKWIKKLNSRLPSGGNFSFTISRITGFKPKEVSLYELAFVHSSVSLEKNGQRLNYERLEFLGDALLGAIVAHHLYQQFPTREEGFLTSMRSKIVSRKNLNDLALQLGIHKLVKQKQTGATKAKSINGDVLEALVGAVFLDLGYKACQRFIEQKIFKQLIDLNQLQSSVISHKSELLEWAAKNRQSLKFRMVAERGKSHAREYEIEVICNGEVMGKAVASSKKKAEEIAASAAYKALNLSHDSTEAGE